MSKRIFSEKTSKTTDSQTHAGELDEEDEEADIGLPWVQRASGRLVPGHF